MPITVTDEKGVKHIFPDEATPEMIAKAMNVSLSSQVVSPSVLDNLRTQNAQNDAHAESTPWYEKAASFLTQNIGSNPMDVPSGMTPHMPNLGGGGQVANYQQVQGNPTPRQVLSGYAQSPPTLAQSQNPVMTGLKKGAAQAFVDTNDTAMAGYSPVALASPMIAASPVLKGTTALVFGAQGGKQIQDAGLSNSPEAWQQRLQGGAMVTGAGAGALSTGADIFNRSPLSMKPSELLARGKQALVYPEAANLSPKAINAVENIFQAAAPTGTNEGFRGNLYAAAPDLAEIGRNINLAEQKGGIINPDMRPAATVRALDSYMKDMYQQERAPQIQRNADTPIDAKFGIDAKEGMKYMSRSAGTDEIRGIAKKAADGTTLTVAEADKLAIAANKVLTGFESMTAADRSAAAMTNRRMGAMKALDVELGKNLNATLEAAGEPGLRSYERRYAALSEIRSQLGVRTNAVELNRPGIIKGVIKPVVGAFKGGPSGIASASQAAVADVNIGRKLQTAFSDLAATDLQPNRSIRP